MAHLTTLATTLLTTGPQKVESTPRRVRAIFNGVFLFNATAAKWVWEHKYFPQFWVPLSAVTLGVFTKGKTVDGEGSVFVGGLSVARERLGEGGVRSTERVLVFEKGVHNFVQVLVYHLKSFTSTIKEFRRIRTTEPEILMLSDKIED